MPHFSLSLLGTFHAALDGELITHFESNRVRALLAYLAVEADRPHHRGVLAEFLWPEKPDRTALNNLRSALSRLRSTLGDRESEPHLLLVSRDTIQFNTASDYWLDVTEFERHMADCGRQGAGSRPQSEIQNLELAIELYHGPFLEGFSLKGSRPFEEWALLKREEIDRRLLWALHRLATLHERRGEHGQAEAYARRQLELEPWSEEANRQLMRLLALGGQRSAALAQYEACRRLLAHELGVDPEPETTALYESIREGEYAEGQKEWAGEQPQSSAHALPSAAPPFVDRAAELAKLDRFLGLALAGQGQAAFVTGDAGSGKTALLAEFARRAMDRHGDLVVAASHCSAYGGIGDPYLPFREIVQMLSGDFEAQRAGGAISGAHSRRLRALLPAAVQALIESGPDLIDRFVPAAALALRVEAFSPWPGGAAVRAACRAHLLDPARRVATFDPLPAMQHLAGEIESRSGVEGVQAGLFAQVTRVLQVLARHRVLILVLDDLQWADPGSISLLFHLGRHLAGSRILLIGAYRPDDVALGRDGERHPLEQVVGELQRGGRDILVDLSRADGRQLVDAMCDAEVNRLGVTFRETLYRHTAGNPLFTIELLRGLQERGELVRDQAGQWIEGPVLHWEQLPPRVEAAIAERIGRLPAAEQAILAAASVEGDEFTAEVVAHVLGLDQRQITHKLSGPLSQQQLVHAQGRQRLGPDGQRLSRYRFHHHLFQAYLYQRLDEVQRAELHEAVGRALETLYGEQAAEVAAKLAWHFEAAGLAEKAVSYLLQAGNRAMRLAAREEAIALFNQGLALLQTLPTSSAHARQELSLQLSLGAALLAGRGWGAPERGGALDRALALSQTTDVGGPRQLFSTLSGFISYYVGRGESRAAHDLAEQLLSLAQQTQDPAYMAVAHGLLGATWLNLGEIITGRSHFEQAIALYDAQQAGSPDSQALMETGAARRAWLGLALWALGYPDQALVRSQEALAEARGLGDALTLAFVLALGVALHILRRESVAAQSQTEELRRLAGEKDLAIYHAWAVFYQGLLQAGQGQFATGIDLMRQGMAASQALGMEAIRPQHLALLAGAYGRAGQAEASLSVLAEAQRLVEPTGMRLMEAELFRLRGEMLLAKSEGSGMEAEAESCYRRALEVARRQQARSWELRATTSLARLWRSQGSPGRTEEAREMLAEIYGWFTEGLDTLDLRDARVLLEELG